VGAAHAAGGPLGSQMRRADTRGLQPEAQHDEGVEFSPHDLGEPLVPRVVGKDLQHPVQHAPRRIPNLVPVDVASVAEVIKMKTPDIARSFHDKDVGCKRLDVVRSVLTRSGVRSTGCPAVVVGQVEVFDLGDRQARRRVPLVPGDGRTCSAQRARQT
jgi:hypothetical protein